MRFSSFQYILFDGSSVVDIFLAPNHFGHFNSQNIHND